MEPWQSWVVVLLGGGVAWYYYTSRQRPKGRTGRATAIGDKVEARTTAHRQENSKARRSKDEMKPGSGSESAERAVGENKKQQKVDRKPAKMVVNQNRNDPKSSEEQEDDEKATNREFAEQMAGLKSGTSLAVPIQGNSQRKTLGQSRANTSAMNLSKSDAGANGQSSRNVSATSSTTGGDADDDLSPAVSPSLAATSTGPRVSGKDVSDMLEAPSQGPSVLRITESTQPAKAPRAQQPKPSQPTETKKQRQNRRKAEERKAARTEAEVERRALLEKQLRTAREAEGRPAKNGMSVSSSAPPASSVWNSHKHATSNDDADLTPAADTERLPLLNTFNNDQHANNQGSNTQAGRPNGGQVSKNWHEPLPSEEEQMRMINELDDNAGWNTVSKGKRGRKNRGNADGRFNGQESSESESRLENSMSSTGLSDVAVGPSHAKERSMGQMGHQDPRSAVDASLNGYTSYRHPADSDWAVL